MADTLKIEQQFIFTPSRDTQNKALAVMYAGTCSLCTAEVKMRYRQRRAADFPASLPLGACPACGNDLDLLPALPTDADQDVAL